MQRIFMVGLVGILSSVLLGACSGSGETQGQKRIDDLTKAINKYAGSLTKAKEEFQTMMSEYDQVINNTDGDLLGHFKKFNTGRDKVEKRRQDAAEQLVKVEEVARPYFQQWKADLSRFESEDLRKRAQTRMKKTKERFEKLDKIGARGKELYRSVMTSLADHALALGNDLNKEGVALLQKDSEKVKKEADELLKVVDQILDATKRYNEAVAMRTEPKQSSS